MAKKYTAFLVCGYLILILSFSFYLIACFPGLMTTDSLYQWREFVTHKYYDWHPIIYTVFCYLCTRIWYSPASVAIMQILILSSVFIYGINTLIKMGVNKIVLAVTLALFAVYPANGFLVITLWKDVIYSVMLLLMTIIIMNIAYTKGEMIKKRSNIVLFAICSLGVLLFRYNGILAFMTVIAGLVFAYKKYAKVYILLTLGMLAIYFFITGPVSNIAGVEKITNAEALGVPMQQVAAVIHFDGKLTQEQKDFFNKILPLDLWDRNYNPYSNNPIKFDKEFNVEFISSHKLEFLKYWLRVVINNPAITGNAYLKLTSFIWRVKPYRDSYAQTVTLGIEDNEFGLQPIMINNSIHEVVKNIYDFTNEDSNLIWFWRPALWLYAAITAGFIIMSALKWKALLVLTPIISNAVSFMIATPAPDFRYQYGNVLTAFILIPLAVQVLINKGRLHQ